MPSTACLTGERRLGQGSAKIGPVQFGRWYSILDSQLAQSTSASTAEPALGEWGRPCGGQFQRRRHGFRARGHPPRLTPPTLPPIPRLGPQAFLPVASLVRIQGIGGVPKGLNHERI